MPSTFRAALVAVFAATALAACSQTGSQMSGGAMPGTQSVTHKTAESRGQAPFAKEIFEDGVAYHRVCGDAQYPGRSRCHALLRDDFAAHQVGPDGTPGGLHPADLQAAYGLNVSGGTGQLVAIVDAYDNPNVEADLGVYRAEWGLPACTTANGCFRKTDQKGGTNYPEGDTGWGLEMSLDVDMVSANCPNCKILVVEGNSNNNSDLATAVREAKKLGAVAISNSYGGSEYSGEDSHTAYNEKRTVTASNGDSGYGTSYPAASRYVTAVGGTVLEKNANVPRGWTETVWGGTGSGCSQYATKPSWQLDTGCTMRTMGDVAYDGSPATGPAIYDTYGSNGWEIVGGTSVGSPAIAAIYALSGNAKKQKDASYGYAHTSGLNDVTMGHNGTNCNPAYRAMPRPAMSPTGNGTPSAPPRFKRGGKPVSHASYQGGPARPPLDSFGPGADSSRESWGL